MRASDFMPFGRKSNTSSLFTSTWNISIHWRSFHELILRSFSGEVGKGYHVHIEKRFNDSCGCCLWKGELVRNGDKIVSELKRSSSDSSIYQLFFLKVNNLTGHLVPSSCFSYTLKCWIEQVFQIVNMALVCEHTWIIIMTLVCAYHDSGLCF